MLLLGPLVVVSMHHCPSQIHPPRRFPSSFRPPTIFLLKAETSKLLNQGNTNLRNELREAPYAESIWFSESDIDSLGHLLVAMTQYHPVGTVGQRLMSFNILGPNADQPLSVYPQNPRQSPSKDLKLKPKIKPLEARI
jgi:hypothetical protein